MVNSTLYQQKGGHFFYKITEVGKNNIRGGGIFCASREYIILPNSKISECIQIVNFHHETQVMIHFKRSIVTKTSPPPLTDLTPLKYPNVPLSTHFIRSIIYLNTNCRSQISSSFLLYLLIPLSSILLCSSSLLFLQPFSQIFFCFQLPSCLTPLICLLFILINIQPIYQFKLNMEVNNFQATEIQYSTLIIIIQIFTFCAMQ